MLKIDVLTIFPEAFSSVFTHSILKRAQEKNLVTLSVHNLRKWSSDKKHGKVDDPPYGGGPGMVMMLEPIYLALQDLKSDTSFVILLSASGTTFTQKRAISYAAKEHIIFICGHYEGIDNRVSEYLVNEDISIGHYVLTGGELPAMVLIDSVTRLIPGVLGNSESVQDESFSEDKLSLEYPQYTRPENYNGLEVPEILLSGNHKKIDEWRNLNRKTLAE